MQQAIASPYGFLGRFPERTSVRPFRGPRDTLMAMREIALGPRGEKSHVVRQFTEWVVREVQPKDYLGEILAVRNAFVQPSPWKPGVPLFRYMNDPTHVEWIKDPQRQVEEIMERGSTITDCDEASVMMATMLLQLGRAVKLTAVGFSPRQLTHVGTQVKEPKSGKWLWLDSVAGPREREAAQRAVEVLTLSLE